MPDDQWRRVVTQNSSGQVLFLLGTELRQCSDAKEGETEAVSGALTPLHERSAGTIILETNCLTAFEALQFTGTCKLRLFVVYMDIMKQIIVQMVSYT